jgi:hypothetical protein
MRLATTVLASFDLGWIAKRLRIMPSVERFIGRYPGNIEVARTSVSPGLLNWVTSCLHLICRSNLN